MKEKSGEKTASITVRLDPKLKYGLEILARKQYRNISSLVEWALNRILTDEKEGLPFLEKIWDVDEADRFIKLALYDPGLLTYDEQKIWKLIKESYACWEIKWHEGDWLIITSPHHARWNVIRENWNNFIKVAEGKLDRSVLPQRDLSNEIPF